MVSTFEEASLALRGVESPLWYDAAVGPALQHLIVQPGRILTANPALPTHIQS